MSLIKSLVDEVFPALDKNAGKSKATMDVERHLPGALSRAVEVAPFTPDVTGPYLELTLDLNDLSWVAGKTIPATAQGIYYCQAGSAPHGIIQVSSNQGNALTLRPGNLVRAPFQTLQIKSMLAHNLSQLPYKPGVTLGNALARLVVLLTPDAVYLEPNAPGGQLFSPVCIMGDGSSPYNPTSVVGKDGESPNNTFYSLGSFPIPVTGWRRIRVVIGFDSFASGDAQVAAWFLPPGHTIWKPIGNSLTTQNVSAEGYTVFDYDCSNLEGGLTFTTGSAAGSLFSLTALGVA